SLAHRWGVEGAAFSRDGTRVLSWDSGNEGRAAVWEAATGKEFASYQHEWGVRGAVFSRDESRVLSWGGDRRAAVWEAATGKEVAAFPQAGMVEGAAFSRDEARVLSWVHDTAQIRYLIRLIDTAGSSRQPADDVVILFLEVRTATRLDDAGQLALLPRDEW